MMKSILSLLMVGVTAGSLSSCVVPVERTVIREKDRHEHHDRGRDRDRRDGRDRRDNDRDGRYGNDRRDSSYKRTTYRGDDRQDDSVRLYIR